VAYLVLLLYLFKLGTIACFEEDKTSPGDMKIKKYSPEVIQYVQYEKLFSVFIPLGCFECKKFR